MLRVNKMTNELIEALRNGNLYDFIANVWSRNLAKANMRVVIDSFIEKEGWNK